MNIFEILQTTLEIFNRFWPMFLKGLGITLLLSAITVLGGTFFGTIITLLRLKKGIIKVLCDSFVELIRGIPLLLQLIIIVLLLPANFDHVYGVSLALIINSSAYVSEIMRAGIQAVDKGQNEAAISLGLSYSQTMRKVILPQAIKNVLPALGNEFVAVIKETSLASSFFIGDLMTVRNTITNITFLALEPYIIIALIYFLMTFSLSKLVKYYESRLELS